MLHLNHCNVDYYPCETNIFFKIIFTKVCEFQKEKSLVSFKLIFSTTDLTKCIYVGKLYTLKIIKLNIYIYYMFFFLFLNILFFIRLYNSNHNIHTHTYYLSQTGGNLEINKYRIRKTIFLIICYVSQRQK